MEFPETFDAIMEGGPAALAAGEGEKEAELAASADMDPMSFEELAFGGPPEPWTSDSIDDAAEIGPLPVIAGSEVVPGTQHAPGPRYLDLARHEGGTPGAGIGLEVVDPADDIYGTGDAVRSDNLGITG
jgi:hypothetical protein